MTDKIDEILKYIILLHSLNGLTSTSPCYIIEKTEYIIDLDKISCSVVHYDDKLRDWINLWGADMKFLNLYYFFYFINLKDLKNITPVDLLKYFHIFVGHIEDVTINKKIILHPVLSKFYNENYLTSVNLRHLKMFKLLYGNN